MNYRTIAVNLGKILLLSAFFYLFPILICLVYGEYAEILSFAAAILVSCVAGGVLWLFRKGAKKIRTKEGLVIVGLSWILVSAVGALPFFLNGCIPNYLDCLFETVSGFTTTGAHRSHRFRHSPQYALLAGVHALAGRHGNTCFHACDSSLSGRGELSADEVRVTGTAGGQARQQGAADGNDSLRHLFCPDSPRMDPVEMRRYGLVQFADHLHEHGGNGRVCRHGGKRKGISQRLYGYRRHDLHAGIQRQFQSLLSRYSGKDRQCFEGRGISLLFFIRIFCDIRRHIG